MKLIALPALFLIIQFVSLGQSTQGNDVILKTSGDSIDKGEVIFSRDHKSFRISDDACKVTLNDLPKRTPIYQK